MGLGNGLGLGKNVLQITNYKLYITNYLGLGKDVLQIADCHQTSSKGPLSDHFKSEFMVIDVTREWS